MLYGIKNDEIPKEGWDFVLAHRDSIIKISQRVCRTQRDQDDVAQMAMVYIASVAPRKFDGKRCTAVQFCWSSVRHVARKTVGDQARKVVRGQVLVGDTSSPTFGGTVQPTQHASAVLSELKRGAQEGAFEAAMVLASGMTGPEIKRELGITKPGCTKRAASLREGYATEPLRVVDCSHVRPRA